MNMTYEGEFFINPFDMEKIDRFQTTRLQEILAKTNDPQMKEQINRDFLSWWLW